MFYMVGASNKCFDCLACGIPLLVSNYADWEKTYVEPRYALSADPNDPSSIAFALEWFLNNPGERCAMGERGRQKILDDWNYEKQFKLVLELLESS